MRGKRILSWLLTVFMSISVVFGFMPTADAAHGTAQTEMLNKVSGDSTISNSLSNDDETVTFIVEVEGDPLIVKSGIEEVSDTEKTAKLLAAQQSVMSRINSEIDANARKGFVYTSVFNGFSMEGTMDQLDEIKALDGVKNVYISSAMQLIEPVDDGKAELMLNSAGKISDINYAYNNGYNGEGTVIAIIDSGCDTSHDFFKTAPENPRYSKDEIDNLVKTLPLNAGAASGNQVYKNAKIPYAYNYSDLTADTYIHDEKHGTHVAGIAAGKNGVAPDGSLFSGIAPEAQLLILSCSAGGGYVNSDATLAALNDAVLLEADVVNMSFGNTYYDALVDDFYHEVLSRCREAGVSVMVSNGNYARGYNEDVPTTDRPDYSATGVPAGESATTSVAAVNNTTQWYEYISLIAPNPDGTETEYEAHFYQESNSLEAVYSGLEDGTYLDYVYCGLGKPDDFSDVDVSGKLALIQRGEITFVEKAQNAKDAGAVGILVYNYEEEIVYMQGVEMPAVSLAKSVGEELLKRADDYKKLRYNGKKLKTAPNPDAGTMVYYSSWGVGSTLELKPEISAPGRKIYSSVPDNKYEAIGGTSMAAPYMAGVTAISRQYYKTNPFLEDFNGKTGNEMTYLIENLVMNSASILLQENGVPYSPRVQGAGVVDMEGILKSRVLLVGDSGKAKISLGDDLADTINLKFDITNISKEDITFDKITVKVLTDGYEPAGDNYLVSDSVTIPTAEVKMPESVMVSSGKTVTFEAEVKLDADFIAENKKIFTNGFYIDGFVILENENEALKASIPFTGFYGDWGAAPIFDKTIYDKDGCYFPNAAKDNEVGTYLAAEYSTEKVILGKNLFSPEIIDEKYIAYSTNLGARLNLITTNFRAIKNSVVSIIDSDGNVVISNEYEKNLPKFIPITTIFSTNVTSELEEGEYKASIKSTVLGDTDRTDELSIPFTIDNTYPQILSAVYDEADKTITVKANDNHYLSGFFVAYPGESEQEYQVAAVTDEDYEDGSVTKVIDVSMIEDISVAKIGCLDYALNMAYYDMDYFLDKVGAELTYLGRIKSMTQAEFNIKNNTSDELSGVFVLAFYDDANHLVSTNIQNFQIDANVEKELVYEFAENTQNASYVKLFVWGADRLKPVDAMKKFTLN